MRSFDEEGLERTDDEEWGDRVECENVGPVLYRLWFERICCGGLFCEEVWVTKGAGYSSTVKLLAGGERELD